MIYHISEFAGVELIKKRPDITGEKICTRTSPNGLVIGYIHMMTLSVLGLLRETDTGTWFLFRDL